MDVVTGERVLASASGEFYIPTAASLKTMRRDVSSFHLILKPPAWLSHSEKADWMSFVLSSLGKPVRERMRVTEAESPASEVDMVIRRGGEGCEA